MTGFRSSFIAAVALIASASMSLADQPGADWITKEQVTQKLTDAGYTHITGLKADDGRWEGKGVKNAKIMEFHVDPRTGALTKEKIDD